VIDDDDDDDEEEEFTVIKLKKNKSKIKDDEDEDDGDFEPWRIERDIFGVVLMLKYKIVFFFWWNPVKLT